MSKNKKALLCVAHPDDEVIFFGGLIASKNYDWTILCATDGNADGRGQDRRTRFTKSCELLGVHKVIFLQYPDLFNRRLKVQSLITDLKKIKDIDVVFTHGILGEYGHQHHQDVCYAVHHSFQRRAKIYAVAYNTFPDLLVPISQKLFSLKAKIYWQVYQKETQDLLHFLPVTFCEGFVRLSLAEVDAIYDVVARKKKNVGNRLKKYAWLKEYIQEGKFKLRSRPF